MPRLYTCRATRTQPSLVVTKDWQLWALWDDASNVELCGFNIGEFTSEQRTEGDT